MRRVQLLLERLMLLPLSEWKARALAAPAVPATVDQADVIELWIARDNVKTAMFRFESPEGRALIRSADELELVRKGTERLALTELLRCPHDRPLAEVDRDP